MVSAIAALVITAGVLVGADGALAATYNATTEAQFESALASANTAGGANTINVTGGAYNPTNTLAVSSTDNLTVNGPTASASANAQSAKFTGGSMATTGNSVFTVASGGTLTLNDILLTNAGAAGVQPAIDASGTININQTTLSGNGLAALKIESGSTATLTNSTVSDGISGPGIIDGGTATLKNVTVTRNPAGGIDNSSGSLSLINSIVAQDTGAKDCYAAATTTDHSLDGDGSCGVGTLSSKAAGLGSLRANGGSTTTSLPSSTSPALAAGNSATCLTIDQRGASRPAACDLGAVQTAYAGAAPTLTNAPVRVPSTTGAAVPVSFTATWADANSPVNTTSCTPASGSSFAVGNTTVTCNGTDVFNNSGSGTFVVTVVAESAPTITVPGTGSPSTVIVPAVDATGATYTFSPAPSATDAYDGTDPVTCDHTSGAKYPLGNTTVTCTSKNSSNQTATASFVVSVKDQTAPVVTVPNNMTVVGGPGTVVNYSPAPSATDNVDGTDPVTCVPASGSAFNPGTTPVTCSATDAAGNTGTATFTVTVAASPPDHTNSNVTATVNPQLSITAGQADFGVILPGVAGDYSAQAAASVTSTDSTSTLSINDASTATTTGHLINAVTTGPNAGTTYSLAQPLQDKATSTSGLATGSTYSALLGSPRSILSYSGPVTSDAVTVGFTQHVGANEVLHNGTYRSTVLLQLAGTP